MPKEQNNNNSLADFQFDDNEGWFENTTTVGKETDASSVVSKVKAKAGTTIDEVEDDDDDSLTNLDDKTDANEEDKDEEVEIKKTTKVDKSETSKPKEVKKKLDKDEEEDKDEEQEEDELENEDFFNNKEEKEKPKDKKAEVSKSGKNKEIEDKDEVIDDDIDFTELALQYKDKGIFENIEIPKDKKLTEDEFFDLSDAEIQARVDLTLEDFTKNMDEDAKAFIKHKRNGGSTKEFVDTYYGSGLDYDKIDLEDDRQAEEIVRFYVTNYENLDTPEDIEDRIQTIKEKGQTKARAEQWVEKLKRIDQKAKDEFDKAERLRIDNKKKANKEFQDNLLKAISETDTVGVFSINKEDQKKLPSFFTKPTIKTDRGYATAFQSKLSNVLNPKTKEDRARLILLGKLLQNDFDASDLVPKAETKVVRRANALLRKNKTESVNTRSGSYTSKTLADEFED